MSVATRPEAPASPQHPAQTHAHVWHQRRGMGMSEAFRVAFEGLMANTMRSMLTMLGIIIGVAAVIVMVSLGQGVAKATKDSIAKLGTNVITVRPGSQSSRGVSQGIGSEQTLKLSDVQAVLKGCPAVKAVSPDVRGSGQVKYRGENTLAALYGTGPEYFQIRNLPIAKGRGFTDDEVKRKAKVVVIGENIRETLFGRSDAINKYMKVNGQNFKVIGVVEKRGESGFRSPDDQITIPVSTAMQRVIGQDYLDALSVQAVSEDKMIEAQDQIMAALQRAHKLRPDQEPDVRVMNQADITESANQQTTFLTMLLAGIAFVSLIVGGIGIMNIMLVSVTERTREIGIRKAIGAKRRDIRYQFLIESITLSLVGGLIGIAIGVGVSLWMALPVEKGGVGFPMMLSTPPIVVAFGFSALVGTFFGMYPAVKASALDPIEALRYE